METDDIDKKIKMKFKFRIQTYMSGVDDFIIIEAEDEREIQRILKKVYAEVKSKLENHLESSIKNGADESSKIIITEN